MDALSETLSVVRLKGAIFFNAKFTAPWCNSSGPARNVASVLAPNSERLIVFHMITEGECFLELDGEPTTRLAAGDVVLFPDGDAHRMASQPALAPTGRIRISTKLARRPRQVVSGGGGAVTRLVCGYLACDALLAQNLLGGLPRVVRVNVRDSGAGAWLEACLRYALMEARSQRPGGDSVLSKFAELLFIEVLRLHVAQQAEGQTGWLAGLRDRIVGAALSQLHARPAHPWTLEALAREAGTSRSVLAERFQRLVGVSPMQYLTQWRMVLAAGLLRHSDTQLTRLAQEVGYQTDTAFIRAFRRQYGLPPAAWRRRHSTAELALAGGKA